MSNFETMEKMANCTLEDFIGELKNLPSYSLYEKEIKSGKPNTHRLLQMSAMLHALVNEELHMMMTTVSLDLMFAMIDQRLRNEIIESGGGVNECRLCINHTRAI